MADNTTLNPGVGGDVIATDDIAGVKYQRIKIGFGEEGTYLDVSDTDPLPVLGPLTDAELRAAPLVVTDATAAELLDGMQTLLLRLLNATNSPRGYDVATGRNRMTTLVESGTITQVSLVPTVTTVGTITNMGGTQAQLLSNGQNVSAWAATVRSRIT